MDINGHRVRGMRAWWFWNGLNPILCPMWHDPRDYHCGLNSLARSGGETPNCSEAKHCCMSGAAGKRGRRLLQLASIAGHTKRGTWCRGQCSRTPASLQNAKLAVKLNPNQSWLTCILIVVAYISYITIYSMNFHTFVQYKLSVVRYLFCFI